MLILARRKGAPDVLGTSVLVDDDMKVTVLDIGEFSVKLMCRVGDRVSTSAIPYGSAIRFADRGLTIRAIRASMSQVRLGFDAPASVNIERDNAKVRGPRLRAAA